jgi:hypothetical protein
VTFGGPFAALTSAAEICIRDTITTATAKIA